MCVFTPSSIDFSIALGRFAIATAGLIAPQRGRTHFNLSATSGSSLPVTAVAAAAPGCQPHDLPSPGAALDCLSAADVPADTRAAPGAPQPLLAEAKPGAVNAFDLNACLTTAAPLDLPERVVEVRA